MQDARKEIATVNRQFMDLVKAGERDGFAQLYTEDAILMTPNAPAMAGRAAALKFIDGMKARGVAEVRLATEELEVFGDTAWERGSSQMLRADGGLMGRGKFIVIWKRTAAGWRLHRDIMNADAPPAG